MSPRDLITTSSGVVLVVLVAATLLMGDTSGTADLAVHIMLLVTGLIVVVRGLGQRGDRSK
jgi:hypothetical protein